jgi:hypothetical protein
VHACTFKFIVVDEPILVLHDLNLLNAKRYKLIFFNNFDFKFTILFWKNIPKLYFHILFLIMTGTGCSSLVGSWSSIHVGKRRKNE